MRVGREGRQENWQKGRKEVEKVLGLRCVVCETWGGRIHGDFLPGAWLQHRRFPGEI